VKRFKRNWVASLSTLALILASSVAHAEMRTINDEAMADVWGQALFEMTNSNLTTTPTPTGSMVGGGGTTVGSWTVSGPPTYEGGEAVNGTISFSKLTFGAEIELDAEIAKLRLGAYTKPVDNGGADVSADRILLTGYQRDGVYYPFKVKNPYLEFAMSSPASSSQRQILGFRFGFEEVDGMLGGELGHLSGRVMLTSKTVTTATGDQRLLINDYDARSNGTAYVIPVASGVDGTPGAPVTNVFKDVEAVCLGRTGDQGVCGAGSDTATKDFWISVSKVNNLYYPKTSADVAEYNPAQKGVWMNLTDNARVFYLRNTADASLDAFKNTGSTRIRW